MPSGWKNHSLAKTNFLVRPLRVVTVVDICLEVVVETGGPARCSPGVEGIVTAGTEGQIQFVEKGISIIVGKQANEWFQKAWIASDQGRTDKNESYRLPFQRSCKGSSAYF